MGTTASDESVPLPQEVGIPMLSLASLLEQGLLAPGDQLAPLELETDVDAVVTEDGTVMIDGIHEFDDLDEATRSLDVTNISGSQFWALERDGALQPLSELVSSSS